MTKRRVWHLVSNRWFSAITAYAINSAKALEILGHTSFFTSLENSPADIKSQALGFQNFPIHSFNILSYFKLKSIFYKINPEIIITYGGPEEFLVYLLPCNKKKIFRFVGYHQSRSKLFKRYLGFKSHLLSPSSRIKDLIISSNLKKKPQISIIPLGIDTKIFYRNLSLNVVTKSKKPEIVIFGRLDPVKGHAEFIKIFGLFLKQMKNDKVELSLYPCLHIIGLPANIQKSDLEATAKTFDLVPNEDIKINCQQIPDPSIPLSSACLGVISSLGSEEICRVAQEFLLCGTPIIVSGVGALEEVLFEGAGVTYKNKNEQETATLLKQLYFKSLNESSNDKKMRSSKAKKLFSLEKMGKNLSGIIEL